MSKQDYLIYMPYVTEIVCDLNDVASMLFGNGTQLCLHSVSQAHCPQFLPKQEPPLTQRERCLERCVSTLAVLYRGVHPGWAYPRLAPAQINQYLRLYDRLENAYITMSGLENLRAQPWLYRIRMLGAANPDKQRIVVSEAATIKIEPWPLMQTGLVLTLPRIVRPSTQSFEVGGTMLRQVLDNGYKQYRRDVATHGNHWVDN
jgi:hypothetical protein